MAQQTAVALWPFAAAVVSGMLGRFLSSRIWIVPRVLCIAFDGDRQRQAFRLVARLNLAATSHPHHVGVSVILVPQVHAIALVQVEARAIPANARTLPDRSGQQQKPTNRLNTITCTCGASLTGTPTRGPFLPYSGGTPGALGVFIDHDPDTMLVRGLLCRHCNTWLEGCPHVAGCPWGDYLNDPPAAALNLPYPRTALSRRIRRPPPSQAGT
ncbi:hypothetical protein [Streptosporangium sp. OZ121]|uniref:hypothetical protein n=1 Tax=Streptosporangium sp. OZ121 TaxID=3444183 RepID=UPI003F7B0AED